MKVQKNEHELIAKKHAAKAQELTNELSRFKESLQTKIGEIKNLKHSTAAQSKDDVSVKSELLQEIEVLRNVKESLERDILEKDEQILALENELNESKGHLNKLAPELHVLKSEFALLSEDHKDLQRVADTLKKEKKELKQSLEKTSEGVSELKIALEVKTKQLEVLKETADGTQDSSTAKIDKLKEKLRKMAESDGFKDAEITS